MATNAALSFELLATVDPPAPATGPITERLALTRRWTNGQGSGMVDRTYHATGTLTASGTVTLNLLAAGALKDRFNNTVDLDELKAIAVTCTSGAIKVIRAASNGVAMFTAAGEGAPLATDHGFAFTFGAAGLSLGSNASITITETSGTAGATYEIILTGAE